MLVVLILLLIATVLISVTLGAAHISIRHTVSILLSRVFPGLLEEGIRSSHVHIIMQLRIPRILTALFVGAGLAVSGTVFQAVFRNPMADPFILGISSGAALGVAVGLITGFSTIISLTWGSSIAAFAGGVGATLAIYLLAGRSTGVNTLLLAGIAMNFMLSSVMSLLLYFNRENLESVIYWNMGSLSSANWEGLSVLIPVVLLGTIGMMLFTRELNALTVGDETARSVGIPIHTVRIIVLMLATVTTSAGVAVSGTIGFVGLIIPHIVRLLIGPNHRILLPCAALCGACFVAICDALARSLMPPSEIPVGIITALAGAPYFIYLLKRRGRNVL